jgi:methionyl-tRNA formyltransferase
VCRVRVVFMGSPEFAVSSLDRVAAHHDVALVVTQPDKPAGRGKQLTPPPVKVAATARGLPIAQPRSVRPPEVAGELAATGAELGIVVAYGKILPPAVLAAFPRGCINVHGSILPRYRGAAPVQRAVIDGLTETGVSIMQLDPGMDTGPVYAVRTTPIGPDETAGELMLRLAPIGADLLLEVLAQIAAGTAVATAQDHALATHAAMLDRADGYIDFTRPAVAVSARIRGVDPWPGAIAIHRGERVKLFGARVVEQSGRNPGEVLAIDVDGAVIATGDGAVRIHELTPPGRKRMTAAQLAAGRGLAVGDQLATAVDPPPSSPPAPGVAS